MNCDNNDFLFCCEFNYLASVKNFCERKSSGSLDYERGLFEACVNNSTKVALYLIDLGIINMEKLGSDCLYYACMNGNVAIVAKILTFDFKKTVNWYRSWFAAAVSGNSNVLDALMNAGMDPSTTDDIGWNALHYAHYSKARARKNDQLYPEDTISFLETKVPYVRDDNGMLPSDWVSGM